MYWSCQRTLVAFAVFEAPLSGNSQYILYNRKLQNKLHYQTNGHDMTSILMHIFNLCSKQNLEWKLIFISRNVDVYEACDFNNEILYFILCLFCIIFYLTFFTSGICTVQLWISGYEHHCSIQHCGSVCFCYFVSLVCPLNDYFHHAPDQHLH